MPLKRSADSEEEGMLVGRVWGGGLSSREIKNQQTVQSLSQLVRDLGTYMHILLQVLISRRAAWALGPLTLLLL